MQCQNNLKQLALGCLGHEAAQKWLPINGWSAYYLGDPDKGFDTGQPGGWFFNTLPYIELRPLHDLAAGQPPAAKRLLQAQMASTPINVAYCPTRRRAISMPLGSWDKANIGSMTWMVSLDMRVAKSDYCINSGDADLPGTPWVSPSYIPNGVAECKYIVRIRDITDGTSNTYLLGEKLLNPDSYYDSEDPADDQCAYIGHDWDIARYTALDMPPMLDSPAYSDYRRFGAAHLSGCNMAFCDGSVRTIRYSIQPEIHRRLGRRNDGLPIDGKQF
jgi:prepilin-type processing-associated H-X9-DG protein